MTADIHSLFLQQYDRLWSGQRDRTTVTPVQRQSAEVSLGGLTAEVSLTADRQIITYVPAFRQRTTNGSREHASVGIAIKPLAGPSLEGFSFASNDEESETSIYEAKGPVAARYRTDVLELRLRKEPLLARVAGIVPSLSPESSLAGALISFNAAQAMAVFNFLEAEISDFSVSWKIRSEDVSLYLYDAAEGGGGIAQQAFADWARGPSSALRQAVDAVLRSTCCTRYCDLCILLPRIPEPVVRGDLLDKRLGLEVLRG